MALTTYLTVNGTIYSQKKSGARTHFIHDALGSVAATVNDGGSVVNKYTYKPYGELLSKTGVGEDPKFLWVGGPGYRTTGRRWAEKYVRIRHYGEQQGMWTTVDPLWPGEWPYCYVGGNPTSHSDPSGNIVFRFPDFQEIGGTTRQRFDVPAWVDPCPDETDPAQRQGFPYFRFPGEGGIDFGGFGRKPKPPSGSNLINDEAWRCDPSDINRAGIEMRRSEVANMVRLLCGNQPLTQPVHSYQWWARTAPCYEWFRCADGSIKGKRIKYRIRFNLDTGAYAKQYFGDKGDIRGLGCIICCLLRHERDHGRRYITEPFPIEKDWPEDFRRSDECKGWTVELECLDRVLRGEKC